MGYVCINSVNQQWSCLAAKLKSGLGPCILGRLKSGLGPGSLGRPEIIDT